MADVAFGSDPVKPHVAGVIGIFCRPNHPAGWGQCPHRQDERGYWEGARAHGYVTLMVVSPTWVHHEQAKTRMAQGGTDGTGAVGIWGTSDRWFGGPYECVFAFEGTMTTDEWLRRWGPFGLPKAACNLGVYGDNRCFALYTYEEVMAL